MKQGYVFEQVAVKKGFLGDLNGAAQESARFDLGKAHRVAFLVQVASAAVDLGITLRQHDAASGGNSKDLELQNSYAVKVDGSDAVRKEMAAISASITITELNGAAGYAIVEVLGEDLDRDLNFSHASIVITDPAIARIACISELSHMPKEFGAYLSNY